MYLKLLKLINFPVQEQSLDARSSFAIGPLYFDFPCFLANSVQSTEELHILGIFFHSVAVSFLICGPKTTKFQIGAIDFAVFAALPILLWFRFLLIEHIDRHLSDALETAHRVQAMESLMNEARCTILPREQVRTFPL
jgi:hypothetical protein